MGQPVQYLRLIGRIRPDNSVVLRPSYLTNAPRFAEDHSASPVAAELLDDDGKLLLRHGLLAKPYCADGRVSNALALRADVPFPKATRTVRLWRKEALIEEIDVSKHAPKVELTWRPPKQAKGEVKVAWQGSHKEKRPLTYFLRYSYDGGKRWRRASRSTKETSQTLDFDQFPGGKSCALAVVATDGVNTSIAESKSFTVPVKSCRAMILAPEDGSKAVFGETVVFEGQGFWLEEVRAETELLAWHSSRDGALGEGQVVATADLSKGLHKITLTAGKGKRAGKTRVSVKVG